MTHRRAVSLAVTTIALAVGLCPLTSSNATFAAPAGQSPPLRAAAGAGQGCMPQTYSGSLDVATYRRRPWIAHRSVLWLAAGSSTTHETAAFEARVLARARLDIGVDLGARRVFRQVKRHFGSAVQRAGRHTAGGKLELTDIVGNPTSHRKEFVAFDGVSRYAGKFYLKTCGRDGVVRRIPGHYVTFSDYTVGVARCGAGDAGSRIVHVALTSCR
jgi:hypothetical protein